MKLNTNEMFIYYDPDSSVGKQVLAYAQMLSSKINYYSYKNYHFTTTRWHELLSRMNMQPKQLLNKSHPLYQEKIRGRSYDDEGWLNILRKHPELIGGSIVVKGHKAVYCKSPSDIFKLASL